MQKTGAEVVDEDSTENLNLLEVPRHCLGTLGTLAQHHLQNSSPFLSLSISSQFVVDWEHLGMVYLKHGRNDVPYMKAVVGTHGRAITREHVCTYYSYIR